LRSLFSWLRGTKQSRTPPRRRRSSVRLTLEALEDRAVPSSLAVYRFDDDVAERGTLRWAVAHATDGDTIRLSANLADTPIVLSHGELLLSQDVPIEAVGQQPVTVSGGGVSRIFEVAATANVNLINLTLTGGNGHGGSSDFEGFGGAILNFGTLTV